MSTSQIFWELWNRKGYQLPSDTQLVYFFELSSEKQQLIVARGMNIKEGSYTERIVLHGARNMKTLQEVEIEEIGSQYGYEIVSQISFKAMDDVIRSAVSLNPTECVGYVVKDKVLKMKLFRLNNMIGLQSCEGKVSTISRFEEAMLALW
jgi:hypothetical protein